VIDLVLALHLTLDPALGLAAPPAAPASSHRGAREAVHRLAQLSPLDPGAAQATPGWLLTPPTLRLSPGRAAGAFAAALLAVAATDALTAGTLLLLAWSGGQIDGDGGLVLLTLLLGGPAWAASEAAGWVLERDPDPAVWPAVGAHVLSGAAAWLIASRAGLGFEQGLLIFAAIHLVAVPLVAVLVTADASPRPRRTGERPSARALAASPLLAALPVADPALRR
jgi:hypothetical protein